MPMRGLATIAALAALLFLPVAILLLAQWRARRRKRRRTPTPSSTTTTTGTTTATTATIITRQWISLDLRISLDHFSLQMHPLVHFLILQGIFSLLTLGLWWTSQSGLVSSLLSPLLLLWSLGWGTSRRCGVVSFNAGVFSLNSLSSSPLLSHYHYYHYYHYYYYYRHHDYHHYRHYYRHYTALPLWILAFAMRAFYFLLRCRLLSLFPEELERKRGSSRSSTPALPTASTLLHIPERRNSQPYAAPPQHNPERRNSHHSTRSHRRRPSAQSDPASLYHHDATPSTLTPTEDIRIGNEQQQLELASSSTTSPTIIDLAPHDASSRASRRRSSTTTLDRRRRKSVNESSPLARGISYSIFGDRISSYTFDSLRIFYTTLALLHTALALSMTLELGTKPPPTDDHIQDVDVLSLLMPGIFPTFALCALYIMVLVPFLLQRVAERRRKLIKASATGILPEDSEEKAEYGLLGNMQVELSVGLALSVIGLLMGFLWMFLTVLAPARATISPFWFMLGIPAAFLPIVNFWRYTVTVTRSSSAARRPSMSSTTADMLMIPEEIQVEPRHESFAKTRVRLESFRKKLRISTSRSLTPEEPARPIPSANGLNQVELEEMATAVMNGSSSSFLVKSEQSSIADGEQLDSAHVVKDTEVLVRKTVEETELVVRKEPRKLLPQIVQPGILNNISPTEIVLDASSPIPAASLPTAEDESPSPVASGTVSPKEKLHRVPSLQNAAEWFSSRFKHQHPQQQQQQQQQNPQQHQQAQQQRGSDSPIMAAELTLDQVMDDAKLREEFKQFSLSELSVENVLFYEDWMRMKLRMNQRAPAVVPSAPNAPISSSPPKKRVSFLPPMSASMSAPFASLASLASLASSSSSSQPPRMPPPRTGSFTHAFENMFHLYILPNSQLELNLLASTRAEIIQKMDAAALGDVGGLDASLFDRAAEEVRQLMLTDTFPRYLRWRQQQRSQH